MMGPRRKEVRGASKNEKIIDPAKCQKRKFKPLEANNAKKQKKIDKEPEKKIEWEKNHDTKAQKVETESNEKRLLRNAMPLRNKSINIDPDACWQHHVTELGNSCKFPDSFHPYVAQQQQLSLLLQNQEKEEHLSHIQRVKIMEAMGIDPDRFGPIVDLIYPKRPALVSGSCSFQQRSGLHGPLVPEMCNRGGLNLMMRSDVVPRSGANGMLAGAQFLGPDFLLTSPTGRGHNSPDIAADDGAERTEQTDLLQYGDASSLLNRINCVPDKMKSSASNSIINYLPLPSAQRDLLYDAEVTRKRMGQVQHSQKSSQQTRISSELLAAISPPTVIGNANTVSLSYQDMYSRSYSANGADSKNHGLTLYMKFDDENISSYQCLVRKQIEIFEATEDDVNSNAQGRNKPIVLGQVGIRCRHCSVIPPRHRTRGATYYPTKLHGLYQAAQNMATIHLCRQCQLLPDVLRQQLLDLRDRKSSAGGDKNYWADGVRVMGVVEKDHVLRFDPRVFMDMIKKCEGAGDEVSESEGSDK